MDVQKTLELDKTERFEHEYNGESYWFDAKVNLITAEFLDGLEKLESEPLKFAESFAMAVPNWSINFGGKDFPPVFDNVKRLPIEFLMHTLAKVGESRGGKKQKPSESVNGSEASAQ